MPDAIALQYSIDCRKMDGDVQIQLTLFPYSANNMRCQVCFLTWEDSPPY